VLQLDYYYNSLVVTRRNRKLNSRTWVKMWSGA